MEPLPKFPQTRPEQLAEVVRLFQEAEKQRQEHLRRIYPTGYRGALGDFVL